MQSKDTITATLGTTQLLSGLLAGAIGLMLVIGYSLLQYRTLGLVNFFGQIPAFLLSPFAGVMVDRVRSVGHSPRAGIIGMTSIPTTAAAPGTPLVMQSGESVWSGAVVHRPFVSRAPS